MAPADPEDSPPHDHGPEMIEIEVLGRLGDDAGEATPTVEEIRRLCVLATGSANIEDGHLAIEFVDERRIAELNARHRGRSAPTDVLSFPIDLDEPVEGPRELGDVVICVEHTADVREAVVHGVLHLLGMDHETDDGEMLALQQTLLEEGSA